MSTFLTKKGISVSTNAEAMLTLLNIFRSKIESTIRKAKSYFQYESSSLEVEIYLNQVKNNLAVVKFELTFSSMFSKIYSV